MTTFLATAFLACLSIDDPKAADPGAAMAVEVDVATIAAPPGAMAALIERFVADSRTIDRSTAPPEIAPAREALDRRFLKSWLDALVKLDFEKMNYSERVDYLLLKNRLDHDLRELELHARQRAEVAAYLPFSQTILDLDASMRRTDRPDGEKTAGALVALTRQVEDAKKAVDAALAAAKPKPKPDDKSTETRPPAAFNLAKSAANRAANLVAEQRTTLRNVHAFYEGFDPQYTWWAAEPYAGADKALRDYETFLRERVVGVKPDDKTTIIGDPIGREALLADLESAMVPYTPEQLVAIAEREFAWCDVEMKKASREMGFGDDWKKALEKVKTEHVPPGEQPRLIRALAIEAIEYVEKHGLVTIPPLARGSWKVDMMSPTMQLVNPFFVYAAGSAINVSFPTNNMTHEQKLMSMRGNNRRFARATVFHELIPGHHLQRHMLDRYHAYRRAFDTPFWMEGWALYWEMTLWDKGFTSTPEDRVGALFWRMHRCARIIFSLKFHLGLMTPQQCIDFLVDRVGHERENATAEVRRSFNGNYGPLYQCAYMLGALQIRALRTELVDTKIMPERDFHDAILKEGGIPIEMVRALLMKQTLPRDFKTNWKFAGEIKPASP